jgi:hypothetical protein
VAQCAQPTQALSASALDVIQCRQIASFLLYGGFVAQLLGEA